MNMKKKLLVLSAIVTVSAAILAGCSASALQNAEYTTAENGEIIITRETAMRVTAEHAKLNTDEIAFTEVKLDNDDGRNEYDIEFVYGGYEFKYEIDAATGAVRDYEKEIADADDSANAGNNAGNTNADAEITVISEDDALAAAIEKAGLSNITKEDLSYCVIELDKDDGRYEYDIEFVYNGNEYDFDVNAENGEIVKFDYEPDRKQETSVPENYIGKEAALAKALEHAGFTEAEISNIHIEFERDDQHAEYDIEFIKDYVEYDYDIDAETGEVIAIDKDAEHVNAPVQAQPSDGEVIGNDAAKAVAFTHAGVDEVNVYDFDLELDYDDGIYQYEIDFECDGYEYNYDIDAYSGEIIHSEKEFED